MVRHSSVGSDLSRAEWEDSNTHVINSIPSGQLLASSGPGGALVGVDPNSLSRYAELVFTFGDGMSAIDNTEPEQWIEVPFNCNIISARLAADISGSFSVDIWKSSFATFPPTVANSIVASNYPILTSAIKSENNLASWIVAIAKGDWIKTHVNSSATCKRVVLSLGVLTS